MKKLVLHLVNASIIIGAFSFSTLLCSEANAQNAGPKATPGSKIKLTPNSTDAELRKKMKLDGLSDPQIDKIIAQQGLFMKKHNASIKTIPGNTRGGQNPHPMACTDLGVENGWSLWQGAIGSNSGGNPGTLQPPVSNPPAPRFNLTSGAGVDPCTP